MSTYLNLSTILSTMQNKMLERLALKEETFEGGGGEVLKFRLLHAPLRWGTTLVY